MPSINATVTGATAALNVGKGEYWGRITSTTWGDATIEVNDAAVGGAWLAAQSYTANSTFVLPGNAAYRLNVATIDTPILFEVFEGSPAADAALASYFSNSPPIISTPVTPEGEFSGSLVIGDKYFASVGRQLEWIFPPESFAVAGTTCIFGMSRLRDPKGINVVVTAESPDQLNGAGTVDAISGGTQWRYRVDADLTGLLEGTYGWSVACVGPADEIITKQYGTVNVIQGFAKLIGP